MPAGPTFEPGGGGPVQSARVFNDQQSIMQRAAAGQREAEMDRMKMAEQVIMRPVKQAQARADLQKAEAEYTGAIETENARKSAYSVVPKARKDMNWIMLIEDAESRAYHSREWISRYSQLANISELSGEFKSLNNLATGNVVDFLKLKTIDRATGPERAFDDLTEGMSEDEIAQAKRVKTGLQGRASGIPNQAIRVLMPDGSEATMVFDRTSGAFKIPSIGGEPSRETDPNKNPLRGATPGDTATQKAEAERVTTLKATKAKRESGLRAAESTFSQMTQDIDRILENVSAATVGPAGLTAALIPGTPAYQLKADLESILKRLSSEAIVALRLASPTGGALGNVSDKDISLLEQQRGAIKQGMSPEEFRHALLRIKDRLGDTIENQKTYFNEEFGQEGGGSVTAAISDLSDAALEARKQALTKKK